MFRKKYVKKGTQLGAAVGGLAGMAGADSLGEAAAGGVAGLAGGAIAGAAMGMAFDTMDKATKPMMKKKTNGKKQPREVKLIKEMF